MRKPCQEKSNYFLFFFNNLRIPLDFKPYSHFLIQSNNIILWPLLYDQCDQLKRITK